MPGTAGIIRFSSLPLLFFVAHTVFGANHFYASPSGSSGGSGSISSPWSQSYAFSGAGGAIHAGDTVYFRGGVYPNPTSGQDNGNSTTGFVAFPVTVSTGTSSAPVIFRAYPGEQPVLDGMDTKQEDIVQFRSPNVWLWGFEIMSSSLLRNSVTNTYGDWSFPDPHEVPRGACTGFASGATGGIKLINCILHDGEEGYANTNWQSCMGAEIYGSLMFNNGWTGPDRHHGHNVYIQNQPGSVRKVTECIIWGASENNVQAYGSNDNGQLVTRNFTFTDDIIFETGEDGGNLLIGGGGVPADGDVVTNSSLYQNNGQFVFNLGWVPYGGGITNLTFTNNYVGGRYIEFQSPVSVSNGGGNTIWYTDLGGSIPSGISSFTTTKPTANVIRVYPNAYEPGRANIAVYNWQKQSSVAVDLSGIFNAGDRYTIIDAQNPTVVVASGTYSGPVSIPMTGLVAVQPIGNGGQTRTHTAPEFGAFIATGGTRIVNPSNPPLATTAAAGSITSSGAQLNGTVNPNGSTTTYRFDYGTTSSYGTSTSSASAGSGSNATGVSAMVTGLASGTTYHYRLVATNSAGTTNGGDMAFTTSGASATPPAVTSLAASGVTASGAQVNGTVNPNGVSTSYHFDYGTTSSYGSSTSAASAGSGSSTVSVNATLSGLSSSTTYHFRLVATNSAGTTNGSDMTFTTSSAGTAAPTVAVLAATGVTASGGQVNGTVNPNGAATTYHFEYGTSASYGSSTGNASAGSGSSAIAVNAALTGLASGTTYHYRLVASSSGGTTNGSDATFTTLSGPPPQNTPAVNGAAASSITATSAQLNGTVNPNGFATTYHFEFGTSGNYGTSTPAASAGSGPSAVTVSAPVAGLTPGTVYHCRLVATSSAGTSSGNDVTFTTLASQPAVAAPAVATAGASQITSTGALLSGTVDPNGLNTTYHFDFGTTQAYGSSTTPQAAGTGTNPVAVTAPVTCPVPGTLYHFRIVATNSGGTVYGGDLTFTSLPATATVGVPDAHELWQNYPNPFNPSTQIDYELKTAGMATLKVFNTLGVEVATLASGFQQAGRYQVQWDGKGCVSGVYFYALTSGGQVTTRRMILVK